MEGLALMGVSDWKGKWDFDADLMPLDFANTAEWHATPTPFEKLNSYSDLVGWAWAAGLLTEDETQPLLEDAAQEPDRAAQILSQAIEIRESIYAIFSAIAAHRETPSEALVTFNNALAAALEHAKVIPSEEGFAWGWSEERELDCMLWPILWAAAELLTSDDLDRVGECADDRGCGYLFFDTSRNRSRRWCNMQTCGNRAKAMRHYNRKTSQTQASP
jgi:predicted RNA-binding Zn ribbon-like protein